MGSVIANMLPLALASIAPVMIILVVVFLTTPGGFAKASAFVLGKSLAYFVIAAIFFWLGGQASSEGGDDSEQSVVMAGIKIVLGALFLVMALKTLFGDTDPDAPPSKLQVAINNMGAAPLFLVGFGISFIQLRFVMLVSAGVAIILSGDLGTSSSVIATVILVFLLVWTILIPIIIYVAMGDNADPVMEKLNTFLHTYEKPINVAVLGILGFALLKGGLDVIM